MSSRPYSRDPFVIVPIRSVSQPVPFLFVTSTNIQNTVEKFSGGPSATPTTSTFLSVSLVKRQETKCFDYKHYPCGPDSPKRELGWVKVFSRTTQEDSDVSLVYHNRRKLDARTPDPCPLNHPKFESLGTNTVTGHGRVST